MKGAERGCTRTGTRPDAGLDAGLGAGSDTWTRVPDMTMANAGGVADQAIPVIISVILVTFHSSDVLGPCLAALERSKAAARLELIIVDNASTDNTWLRVRSYGERTDLPFRAVRPVRLEENRGYAYANNRGLERATGDHLLLLNPDTEVGQGAIERCSALLGATVEMEADRNVAKSRPALLGARSEAVADKRVVGVAGCRLVLQDGRLDRACRRSFPTLWNSFCRFSGLSLLFPRAKWFAGYNLTYLDEHAGYEVDCVSGAFMMVARDAYTRTRGFDEDYFLYGEDIDWCYRIKAAGYAVWYEGAVSTLHVKGGNGGKRSPESLQHFYDTMLLYFRKHHAKRHSRVANVSVAAALHVMRTVHVALWRLRGRGR